MPSMMIDAIWQELEAEPQSITRLDNTPRPARRSYPLLVAFEPATRSRALLLPATRSAIPAKKRLADMPGIGVSCVRNSFISPLSY